MSVITKGFGKNQKVITRGFGIAKIAVGGGGFGITSPSEFKGNQKVLKLREEDRFLIDFITVVVTSRILEV